jgi:DNA modification methylase
MARAMIENMGDFNGLDIRKTERKMNDYKTNEVTGDGWTMYHGDCVEMTKRIADDSIGYSIFSPPFASLYTYSNSDRDMGNCKNSEEFMKHFRFLIDELYRVTIPGRNLSFHCMLLPTSKVRDGVIGLHDFRGDLIRAFQDGGWVFHSEVVIWKDPVTAMQRTKALGLLHKQLKKDSCMSRQGIPDYLVTMRKPGINPVPVSNTNESFPVGEWQEYASPVWMDINPSETLQGRSAREHDDERHICPLQLEVIRRGLRLWSRPGDKVLSPFAGIGSEGYEAIKAGREFVGIELKQSYFEQACANLRIAANDAKDACLFTAGAAK